MRLRRYLLIVVGGFAAITTLAIVTGYDPAAERVRQRNECVAMTSNRLLRSSPSPAEARRSAEMLCQIRDEGVEGLPKPLR